MKGETVQFSQPHRVPSSPLENLVSIGIKDTIMSHTRFGVTISGRKRDLTDLKMATKAQNPSCPPDASASLLHPTCPHKMALPQTRGVLHLK